MKSRQWAAFRGIWGSSARYGSIDGIEKYFYNRTIKLNGGVTDESVD